MRLDRLCPGAHDCNPDEAVSTDDHAEDCIVLLVQKALDQTGYGGVIQLAATLLAAKEMGLTTPLDQVDCVVFRAMLHLRKEWSELDKEKDEKQRLKGRHG